MQCLGALSLIAALAAAVPLNTSPPTLDLAQHSDLRFRQLTEDSQTHHLESRQIIFRTDLEQGGPCPPVIFVYARGTIEPGNLGLYGPVVGDALADHYGSNNVWVQGVGFPYTASVIDNILPRGTTAAAIAEMVRLLNLASSSCPTSKVVAGGYSQGAALAAAAISDVAPAVRDQIVGTILFGYTQNQQNGGNIPNYPPTRLRVYCAELDLVCEGTLIITPAHFSYIDEAAIEAPAFLISKIGEF